jgi:hypothetical protein
MTRSHKYNDKDHSAVAATSPTEPHLPKFFGKNGFEGVDPKSTKKRGGGKGNWGPVGDELKEDEANFNFTKPRRFSNSSMHLTDPDHFKTKFEVKEAEPVFEEEIHGPLPEDLSKVETSSSNGSSATSDEVQH